MSMHTMETRIRALEARLADVEGGFGQTIYKLHRSAVRTDLLLSRIAGHLGIPAVTDEEVDAALDDEA